MKPADLDAIVASTTDPAAATLARALREAWAERDAARVASTPNEREAMLRAALDNREAYARDLAALVAHSDQRAATLTAERDALRAEVATLTQERDEARAERRAARLDRDAAEEKLAALRGGR